MLKLLISSGDVEENAGPTTRSTTTQASCDEMTTLDKVLSGQTAVLNEMKSVRSKLSHNDKVFEDIKQRLAKIEDEFSGIVAEKAQVGSFQVVAEQNTKAFANITTRIDDAEDRARRTDLVFY